MKLRRFHRLFLALWLGVAALAGNAFEQQQLSDSILFAATADAGGTVPAGFHRMPDGTLMAGAMGGHATPDGGGHTHRGHADCDMCGAVAAMAAFTLPVLAMVPLPRQETAPSTSRERRTLLRAADHPAYSSRAPPVVMS